MRKTSKAFQPTANDAFLAKCFEIDAMIEKLQALRADHFGAPADAVHWGHVGSAGYVAEKLAEALSHYGVE